MELADAQPARAAEVPALGADAREVLGIAEIYRRHGDFVWKTLGRFGVPERDRPDQLQEVFVVVHRQLAGYRWDGQLTTWLFGISRRVASGYRRRAYQVHEEPTAWPAPEVAGGDSPESAVDLRRAEKQLEAILDRMSMDQRVVFVMFELDGLTGQEIAGMMACPLQTVFSRLRRAREVFEREAGRLRALDRREGC